MLKFWMAELYHHFPQMNAPPNKLVLARGLIAIWVNLTDSWTLISLNTELFLPFHLGGFPWLFRTRTSVDVQSMASTSRKRGMMRRLPEAIINNLGPEVLSSTHDCDLSDDWNMESLDKVWQSDVLLNDFECTYCNYIRIHRERLI